MTLSVQVIIFSGTEVTSSEKHYRTKDLGSKYKMEENENVNQEKNDNNSSLPSPPPPKMQKLPKSSVHDEFQQVKDIHNPR